MIAQRVGVAALRRGAAKPSSVFFTQTMPKVALTAGLSTSPVRSAGGTKLSQQEGHQILVNQRLNRPISPHLGIYKLEQTWFGSSAWNRITGCTLSGTMYAFMAAYLVAPLAGLHLESASVAAAFGGLPLVVKGGVKFALGFPFVYHLINGSKHLLYDLGKGFAKQTIIKTDLYLWSASIIGAIALVAFV
ncbi:mitochondrial succinate dehydrogenase subunit C [Fusarium albosuccineum]|uniref:Mitochondrial succinate dehydrogenase subunit C n=1 Tax=Fusarium albosuccineum TaxID=1237068 RepID=A0A8H4LF92_9HYPO|nr:mitochondrial succinate dehydrogenase subunit C [Fusarium albosuccineum]